MMLMEMTLQKEVMAMLILFMIRMGAIVLREVMAGFTWLINLKNQGAGIQAHQVPRHMPFHPPLLILYRMMVLTAAAAVLFHLPLLMLYRLMVLTAVSITPFRQCQAEWSFTRENRRLIQ